MDDISIGKKSLIFVQLEIEQGCLRSFILTQENCLTLPDLTHNIQCLTKRGGGLSEPPY